jgi:hypothetical protein
VHGGLTVLAALHSDRVSSRLEWPRVPLTLLNMVRDALFDLSDH